ncbi:MAG: alpha/beta hydrolase [Planctomycetaceae bacterium]
MLFTQREVPIMWLRDWGSVWLGMLMLLVCVTVSGRAVAQSGRKTKERVEAGVVYSETGGQKLLLDVYHPAGNGPHPAVLVVHGGAWMSGDRKQLQVWAKELCNRGYCAVAIDYRLAPDHKFPAQIDDCRAALLWMRKHAGELQIDTAKIGAIGYSAGGHLVALLGTTGESPTKENGQQDTRLQCIVAGGAPCDFRSMPAQAGTLTYWLGGTRAQKPDLYEQASPAAFATKDDAPTFCFNGTKDQLVPVAWTQPLVDALKEVDVEVILEEVPNADHIKAAWSPQGRRAGYDFFDKHLKPQRPAN